MQQISNDGNAEDEISEEELHQKIFNIEKQLKEISKTLKKKK